MSFHLKSQNLLITLRHCVIKMSKVKDKRILKATRGNQFVMYKGTAIRLPVNFLTETLHSHKGIA